MSSRGDSTIDHLNWAYCSLRDAWHVLSTDQARDESAPWHQWQAEAAEDNPATARDLLLTVAEWDAADAVKSVLHHVKLLALAYLPAALTDEGLDWRGWPGFSSYTVARAILEGAALINWLLQPDASERTCRSAPATLVSI